MAATSANRHNPINSDFTLSPRQEELLFAALNSNKSSTKPSNNMDKSLPPSTNAVSNTSTSTFNESPIQAPGSGTLSGFEESPFIDYDYEFEGDDSFNFDFGNDSQGQMIGNLPGSSSDGDADNHEKRSHPDDDEEEEGGGKRREGDDKSSKKPGRKPLTSEPTSKRKAQNRAAQRAFRERKEKHLKDLETKVDDLQKASESANHENSILRAQIERMTMELREYKKRLSLNGGINRSPNGNPPAYFAAKGLSNASATPNDVNFQFEFPRFGRLPGPPITNGSSSMAPSISPTTPTQNAQSPTDKIQTSSRNHSNASNTFGVGATQTPAQNGDMTSFSGLFSPEVLDSAFKSSPFDSFGSLTHGSISSTGSPHQSTNGQNTSYSSPSASSQSNHGTSSSCGTSPEPTNMQSPYNKATDSTLTTIGEENSCGNSNAAPGNVEPLVFDVNGIDWFAQQNNNQFDPQLFGDYREPQNNILSNDPYALDDAGFFTDAFDMPDFNSPFNVPTPTTTAKDLVQQIDEKQNEDNEVVPGEDRSTMLNCNTIWDRLQNCPKVREGEFDLDSLCKDLQKKAKCSETGAVVNEADFQKIMNSYAPKGCDTMFPTTAKKA
ncbi:07261b9d-48cc-421b-ac92-8bab924961f9 [Sclerotinia trifoliorum]|uniref:07261b9d-48cc-421b-ac92-8bab924961f9 n=1 Tax=Sclerotinia trifoliorum TaxID=28548 RepID=A0A8H2W1Z8_9HELO|nr:07261b9d-48cc-421b-ac92-8bab924961f9 [Sclerotinia trifoliorum]